MNLRYYRYMYHSIWGSSFDLRGSSATFFDQGIVLAFHFRFGRSIGSVLVVAEIAWPPTKWVILIGSLLSTIGAGMQSLTG